MAKLTVLDIPAEFDDLYWKTLKPGDRFTYSRVTAKSSFPSRAKLKGLSQKTLLPIITQVWNSLSSAQKDDWTAAALYSSMTGFRLFVQDQTLRIQYNLSGTSVPSINHQAKVGHIHIESPASYVMLTQIHPSNYYIYKKVTGTKSQYEPKLIYEIFSLPFTLGISAKTNLTATASGAYCRCYAVVRSSYQGIDRLNYATIELNLAHDWQILTSVLSTLNGYFISYDIYIEINNARGDLYFDNVTASHDAHNFARDPKCNKIETAFTKAFYQIPKHWAALILPTGASYQSIYPEV
jgi:hypothetical protein